MTIRGTLMAFFPLLFLALGSWTIFKLAQNSVIVFAIGCLAYVYLLPPVLFRVHKKLAGPSSPQTDMSSRQYSSWWGGYQIQSIYIAVPWLESLLRIIPGVYSFWLRLWGSQIGRNVYWTPTVLVSDRDQLIVGDDVVVGHQVQFLSHIIRPRKDSLILTIAPIEIGSRVFIGAGSRLAPGTKVESNVFLPILSDVYPFQKRFREEEREKAQLEY